MEILHIQKLSNFMVKQFLVSSARQSNVRQADTGDKTVHHTAYKASNAPNW